MIRALAFIRPLARPLGWVATYLRARELQQSRRALGFLDPRLMRDAGIDVEAARREAERPVWDAPAGWFDRHGPY
ncbi:MAG: DUF1127 domain-containing protein [Paenirhodobacter sp.]|uniref:DUF1127 domain-containing protein n=1 Tax=Paenirhodobacter sp. TaxID=1965326 RepID=UPI003D1150D8